MLSTLTTMKKLFFFVVVVVFLQNTEPVVEPLPPIKKVGVCELCPVIVT